MASRRGVWCCRAAAFQQAGAKRGNTQLHEFVRKLTICVATTRTAVLSRRTFPPPRTIGMVEPGYRDAPAADESVAFVYVKVRSSVRVPDLLSRWPGMHARTAGMAALGCQQHNAACRPPQLSNGLPSTARACCRSPSRLRFRTPSRPSLPSATIP